MRSVGPRAGSALPHLLLVAMVAELALYRLAVRALRPPGDAEPPLWHHILNYVGLFLFYFASALALGALFARLAQLVRRPGDYAAPFRYLLVVTGGAFLAFALLSFTRVPSEQEQFLLEGSFTLSVVVLVFAQLTARGDIGARIGLVLLAVPFVIHFYGPLSLRFLGGEEVLWGGLPDRLQRYGRWSLVFAALASPYCFSPKPLTRAVSRVAPLAIAVFVGIVGTVILRHKYEVGMELARLGLGIDLGPGAPTSVIALYLMALVAGTWTLVSCLTDDAPSRRRIGVGVGLIFAGGYAFQWPLQYLAGMVGLFTIGDGARGVGAEEKGGPARQAESRAARRFRPPPVSDEAWQGYVSAAVEALRAEQEEEGAGGEEAEPASSLTSRGVDGSARTHVVGRLRGAPVKLTVEREEGSVVAIDVLCGEEPAGDAEPGWTLQPRGERRLGVGRPPEPPACSGAARKTGDVPFDRRFRVRDRAHHTGELLDDGLRARATALIDGWIALWPGRGLRYRVHPGRGAPLDHPIPITELAFRGADVPASPERLLTLLHFLTDLWRHAPAAADAEPGSG